MIPQSHPLSPQPNWQHALANAITDPEILLAQLGLTGSLEAINGEILKNFPLRVPQSYVRKMRYADKSDPLLRQVFPLIDESVEADSFVADPVGDQLAITSPGLLQKYQGRALLLTTGACAIHCRYCFRRHFSYSDSNPLASQWQATIEAINNDPSITEVILSGGDPLNLSDDKLANIINELATIPHIKRCRIHTRLPIVLPERITRSLLEILAGSKLKIVMVIHANHSNELVDDAANAITTLTKTGIQVLNQSVLLRGINDNVDILQQLSERLSELAVIPYYLHLLDPVAGASHFDVNESIGITLIEQLRVRLSGYLVPRLVREQQGMPSKTVIC